jgi:hypothetical protein
MMRFKLTALTVIILLATALFAQSNPVPFVSQPLIPTAVAPGGPGFTLTVNGTGFVSGSVVHWNGSPRTTTFVSASQLTAAILAADIAVASTATITVNSPAPGGGVSNLVYFSVRKTSPTVSLSESYASPGANPTFAVAADFNGDGRLDLATGIANSSVGLTILLGNGDGTFNSLETDPISLGVQGLAAVDLNGDGKTDIAVSAGNGGVVVLLGNGDGTFQEPVSYSVSNTNYSIAAGDFNNDGRLDLAVGTFGAATVLLGNGDGTLQRSVDYSTGCLSGGFIMIAVGDVNSDGQLDLIYFNPGCAAVYVFLGHGDGTFSSPITSALADTYSGPFSVADFNGDGKLDLAVANQEKSSVVILLGNGDGTFQPGVSYATTQSPDSVVAADFNGDGKLDLAVSSGYSPTTGMSTPLAILLGNGDGTFQPFIPYGFGEYSVAVAGDFNDDGLMDLAVGDRYSQSVALFLQDNGSTVSLSPSSLTFGIQLVGTISPAQFVTVTNSGTTTLTITSMTLGTVNFALANKCPKSLLAGQSCKIGFYFTPTTQGNLQDTLSIFDNGGGSPQRVTLSGTATILYISPSNLNFGSVTVHKTSLPQRITLTNRGSVKVQITKISIAGLNRQDFTEINACGTSLGAGTSCTIDVWFTPKATGIRSATLTITDNGGGSPQKVNLAGTGQ